MDGTCFKIIVIALYYVHSDLRTLDCFYIFTTMAKLSCKIVLKGSESKAAPSWEEYQLVAENVENGNSGFQ
jgi:hypothetical protein